ncbi:2549_t:CDS:2 [Acaulospora morrowiae]|uniref:2549_t:CDS:1 n=1 Tax=Acaulospora morrowiae TaxID=94023 RepID=A0A9N9H608_9GLOM|nr:2549_t:CDS:2 [Acaulospora morrowiae]
MCPEPQKKVDYMEKDGEAVLVNDELDKGQVLIYDKLLVTHDSLNPYNKMSYEDVRITIPKNFMRSSHRTETKNEGDELATNPGQNNKNLDDRDQGGEDEFVQNTKVKHDKEEDGQSNDQYEEIKIAENWLNKERERSNKTKMTYLMKIPSKEIWMNIPNEYAQSISLHQCLIVRPPGEKKKKKRRLVHRKLRFGRF